MAIKPSSGLKKPKKKGAQAVDAFKGFAAQPTRMALLLLQSPPGSLVSLEKLDDVGAEYPGGTLLASQMKVGKKNPISDRAEPLWKTFANWLNQVKSKQIDTTRTQFEIYVTKDFAGKLVRKMAEAQSKAAASDAVLSARQLLWGDAPAFPKRPDVASTLSPHLDEIFGSDARMRAFQGIVERFRLTIGNSSPVDDLVAYVRDFMGVSLVVLEKVLVHFHGWVDLEVQRQIQKTGGAPVIARDIAYEEFNRYHLSLITGGTLPDVADEPSVTDFAEMLKYRFIRQLDLIKAEHATRTYAMTCFFKSSTARTRWVENDQVQERSLTELEALLQQRFRDKCATVARPEYSAEQLGRALLAECHGIRCQVELKEPPEYFIPGCYHVLADGEVIGWHPEFKNLLKTVA